MFGHKKFTMTAAACVTLALGVSVQASSMDRRYLALDQSLHGQLINTEVSLKQATMIQEILPFDAQWEQDLGFRHNIAGTVIRDHEGLLRAYYPVSVSGVGRTTAVAFSTDGIHWQKPSATFRPEVLNLSPHLINHPQANIINIEPHPSMDGQNNDWPSTVAVFFDPTAPQSEQYKATWQTGSRAYVATSSDGFNFGPSQLAFEHRNEANITAFYDTIRQAYVMYGRIR